MTQNRRERNTTSFERDRHIFKKSEKKLGPGAEEGDTILHIKSKLKGDNMIVIVFCCCCFCKNLARLSQCVNDTERYS